MEHKSLFNFYSVAIVAEDPQGEGWFIRCWPQEQIPTVSGKIDNESPVKREVRDSKGNVEVIEMKTQNTVIAEWCPIGYPNRVTPPNVKKGMTVLLYRYADNPDFIWTPLLLEIDRMRYEKVITAYSNKPEPKTDDIEGNDAMDECWYTVVDTEAKLWELHTTDNDGEATIYEMGLDALGGQATFQDGEGNKLVLDSVEGNLEAHLNGDVTVTIDKNMTTEVTENIITKSKNTTEEIEEAYTQSANTATINIADSTAITTEKLSISNSTVEIISWLVELIDTMIQEKHTGNLGVPTAMDPGSVQQFEQLKEKIKSFM